MLLASCEAVAVVCDPIVHRSQTTFVLYPRRDCVQRNKHREFATQQNLPPISCRETFLVFVWSNFSVPALPTIWYSLEPASLPSRSLSLPISIRLPVILISAGYNCTGSLLALAFLLYTASWCTASVPFGSSTSQVVVPHCLRALRCSSDDSSWRRAAIAPVPRAVIVCSLASEAQILSAV